MTLTISRLISRMPGITLTEVSQVGGGTSESLGDTASATASATVQRTITSTHSGLHLPGDLAPAPLHPARVDEPAPLRPIAAPRALAEGPPRAFAGTPPRALKPEIQALRAAAVALVLLFHGWPTLVPGGYVGVDVFFVISGYLITGQLLREADRNGSIALLDFWARRARRLLPASFLVLAACAAASFVWAPEGAWRQHSREVAASALYVQNWALGLDAVDYFAASNTPSPVQHFWTLSVEEQFYLGLPLVMLAVLGARRRLARSRGRQGLGLAIAAAGALSFLYSCWLTQSTPSAAYFSTAARAWEFAAGALLSFIAQPLGSWRRTLASSVGWGAILFAAFAFDQGTHLPGAVAALPVLGALLVIGAGSTGSWLRARPIQWLGDHSYSIYLWHWPLLVFAPLVLRRELGAGEKAALELLALVIAAATTRWVEDPIRFSRWPRRPLGRGAIALSSALCMAALVGVSACAIARVEAAERASAVLAARFAASDAPCFGAQARRGAEPCKNPDLAGVLVPNPALAAADDTSRSDCRQVNGDQLRMCSLGPATGYEKRLAAIGDSHLAALLPALEAVAQQNNWRIDAAAKNACHWTTSTQRRSSRANIGACQRWKAALNQQLLASPPYEAILVTHRAGAFLPDADPGEDQQTTIVRGLVESWRVQAERGTRIVAIRDNPTAREGTAACVARHRLLANEYCSLDRASALGFDPHPAATRALPGSSLIDLSELYCDAGTCPAVIGHVVVYRDDNHITGTFSRTLAPRLGEELKRILD